MFVAVSFGEGGRFFRQRAEVRRCVFCGREYYHIIQPLPRGKPPLWGEIARIAGRAGSKLVLERGRELPAGYGLRRLPLEDFRGKLAFAAAQTLLEASGESGEPVGVVDMDGIFCRDALRLLEHASVLKVYTGRPERYFSLSAAAMSAGGAPVVVVKSLHELGGCRLCVSPGRCGRAAVPAPLIAGEDSRAEGRPTINALRLALPPEAEAILPEDIVAEDFFGAMHLCCAAGLPFELRADICRVDGRLAALSPKEIHNFVAG